MVISDEFTNVNSEELFIEDNFNLENKLEIICWICRDKVDIDNKNEIINNWVSPCNCEGIRKYVHQKCLLLYIINQKSINLLWDAKCEWCNCSYLITVQKPSFLFELQSISEAFLNLSAPWLCSTLIIFLISKMHSDYTHTLLKFINGYNFYNSLFENSPIPILNIYEKQLFLILFPVFIVCIESYNWEYWIASKIVLKKYK